MHVRARRATLVALYALAPALGGCSYLGWGGDGEDAAQAAAPVPRVEIVIEGVDEERERNALAFLGLA